MKVVRLAGVLVLLYVIVPVLLLNKNFPPPETWTSESATQFFSGILVFGLTPHFPACLVIFILLVSKRIFSLADLRPHKSLFLGTVFVLIAHWALAALMGSQPVEFGMLVNFFLVPVAGAASFVVGIIVGRLI